VPDESGARGIFPAKVFEYLAAGPPILSLGVATAEVGRVVTTAGRGHHFHRGQVLEMTEFLLAAVGGTLRLAPDTAVIATYSRAKQAARFRELL